MARDKEGVILLLDVGPSMHGVLHEVEKVSSMLIRKKLIYNKFDAVGVVIFGAEGTDNELTREIGGYEHVAVLQNLKVVDSDILRSVQCLPRGTAPGDFLDSIVVGMDLLIKKYQSTNKGKKCLHLITNAICPVKDPYEGTKEDQVSMIATQMVTFGMKMECFIVRDRSGYSFDEGITMENDHLLRLFAQKSSSKITFINRPSSLLGAVRTRRISPVTIFRGEFELSPMMKIKVWVYKKTAEEKLPTLKKYSDKAPSSDALATHEIKVDYEYKSADDPRKVVPPEQRIKGYRYGPQVIPVSPDVLDVVKFKPEKGVKLLGFTNASEVLRHYYMKDVNIFIAEPTSTPDIIAVSALARSMKEMNKVAILRCVWRQGQANVVIGVLSPNVSEDKIPDSFYFNVLPFAEDVREFQFPSFNKYPASWQPNEQQQVAADNLVKMLDLTPPGEEEALAPQFTPNPVLERFYRSLEIKSDKTDAPLPPVDETLETITKPDLDLLSRNKSVLDAFESSFELKENPRIKKPNRRTLTDRQSMSPEERHGDKLKATSFIDDLSWKKPMEGEEISDSTPVVDFERLISRSDNPDWVQKAIKLMKNKIHDLLEGSYEGDNYPTALDCLIALRDGCVREQEPKGFNNFLRDTVKFCMEGDLADFCDLLASRHMRLIPKSEAFDSDVTDDEARNFLPNKELS